jgi:hypothetical protein
MDTAARNRVAKQRAAVVKRFWGTRLTGVETWLNRYKSDAERA